jgi:L-ascorbate metabolism protein UlaG (beta-lactamase superfamily)
MIKWRLVMEIKIKWFPRSWLQIMYNNKIVYIDPSYLESYYSKHPLKIGNGDDGLPEKLPKADIILFTHSHKDHCKYSTLNQLKNNKTVILAPKNCSKELTFKYIIVKPDEQYHLNEIDIKTTNAYNVLDGNSTKKVHKKGACIGYILTINNIKIYHAGDTDLIPDMNEMKDIDIAFLPIGGTFTMDIKEAIKATKTIKPKLVIPIHYINADPNVFCSYFEKRTLGIESKVLSIGEELSYKK